MSVLRGRFAERYFDIVGRPNRNGKSFIYENTVRKNIEKAEKEEDYETAYKLMKLMDEFLDSICL